jgi:DNA-binding transcriptional regulator WhiA
LIGASVGMVDDRDSKSRDRKVVRVRVPPCPPMHRVSKVRLAYIVGVALGDGNLSNPNGRATRLRITCDAKYPKLAKEISTALEKVFPTNKVSVVYLPRKSTYFNISVYSNKLNEFMPWEVGKGTKVEQNAHVPKWIHTQIKYTKSCLRGLLQTDGSIYRDRGYLMINFTNHVEDLAKDVLTMLEKIGFQPTISKTPTKRGGYKYCVRVARNSERLISTLKLSKA